MIPKKIHYCWFGGNPLPESTIKCINSWKKFFPDYEIIQWDEQNYDVNKIAYTKEAYEQKKYAFVSDYARFDILYNNGGIYFDTDVEVINSFDQIIKEHKAFMGQEANLLSEMHRQEDRVFVQYVVNPGLGLGAEKGVYLFKEVIDYYSKIHFVKEDGSFDTTTICRHVTGILENHGYQTGNNNKQNIEGIMIYPADYFCPMNYYTGNLEITENTKSIHWYSATWASEEGNKYAMKRREFIQKYGIHKGHFLYKIYDFPYRLKNKLKKIKSKIIICFLRVSKNGKIR